jgi:isopentenyl-diphosphate delta-isomerase
VWADPAAVIAAVDATPFAFSPWLVEELAEQRLRDALLGR